MMTPQQLAQSLQLRYDNNYYVPRQPMYNLVPSGDQYKDFATFTDLQSGNKSDDPDDAAANFPPPTTDNDGKYYHTVRDITYKTFVNLRPNLSVSDFYEMTDETRQFFINHFLESANITSSKTINTFLGYIIWASGSCTIERDTYNNWYKTAISDDIENMGDGIILDRLADIRLYIMSKFKDASKYPGWFAGVLNLWRLLKTYCT